jgi:DNA-binding MarR family transcriptional regulator
MDKEDLHTLRLLKEIDRGGVHTQRELSRRLDLSLGLVNAFLKRLVNKGYFKVKTMPRNRVKYFLTPEGLARKSKLTVEYLRYSVDFYKDIKNLLLSKYEEMQRRQVGRVLFFGAGEVAELAYLYLQLTRIELAGIVDDQENGKDFFGLNVEGFDRLARGDWDVVLMTRLNDIQKDIDRLIEKKVPPERISTL